MSVARRLKEYLDMEGVKYEIVPHSQAFTAQEVAESVHIPGRCLAKTVIMRGPMGYLMVVVPANHRVDLSALSQAMYRTDYRLATEDEFEELFVECEVGAMPPFGNLYGMPVIVSEALTWDEDIWFNCGTHTEVVRMKYADFARLVCPRVENVSYPIGAAPLHRAL